MKFIKLTGRLKQPRWFNLDHIKIIEPIYDSSGPKPNGSTIHTIDDCEYWVAEKAEDIMRALQMHLIENFGIDISE